MQQQRQSAGESGIKSAKSLDKAHDEVGTLNTKLKSAESLTAELEATNTSEAELKGLNEMESRNSLKRHTQHQQEENASFGRVSDIKLQSKLKDAGETIQRLKSEALRAEKIIEELNTQNKYSQDENDKMRETLKEKDVIIGELRHLLYMEPTMERQRGNDDEKMDGGVGHQKQEVVMMGVLDRPCRNNVFTEKRKFLETEEMSKIRRDSTSTRNSNTYEEFIGDHEILQKIAVAQELTKHMFTKVDSGETSALQVESRNAIKDNKDTLETERDIECLREKVDRRDSEMEILTERKHSLLREVEKEKHNQKIQMLDAASITTEKSGEHELQDTIRFEPPDTIQWRQMHMRERNSFVAELVMFLAFLAFVDYIIRGWDEPVVVQEPPSSTFQDLDLPAFREMIFSLYMYSKAIPFQDWANVMSSVFIGVVSASIARLFANLFL